VVEVEAVVLATVAVALFSPGVSPLALGASPGVLAASVRAYPPWCQPSVALSSSVLQQLGQLRLVEAMGIHLNLWLSKYPLSVSIGR
jgi:hypothetical protein